MWSIREEKRARRPPVLPVLPDARPFDSLTAFVDASPIPEVSAILCGLHSAAVTEFSYFKDVSVVAACPTAVEASICARASSLTNDACYDRSNICFMFLNNGFLN